MGMPMLPESLPLEGWGPSGFDNGGLGYRSSRVFVDTKLEGAFQGMESERLHRQYASDTNLAEDYQLIPYSTKLNCQRTDNEGSFDFRGAGAELCRILH